MTSVFRAAATIHQTQIRSTVVCLCVRTHVTHVTKDNKLLFYMDFMRTMYSSYDTVNGSTNEKKEEKRIQCFFFCSSSVHWLRVYVGLSVLCVRVVAYSSKAPLRL